MPIPTHFNSFCIQLQYEVLGKKPVLLLGKTATSQQFNFTKFDELLTSLRFKLHQQTENTLHRKRPRLA